MNKINQVLKKFLVVLIFILISLKLLYLLNSQIFSVALYSLTFSAFLAFFIFSYKTTPNSIFRWALVFHFIIVLTSAIYHTKKYDSIYNAPNQQLRALALARDSYYKNPPREIKIIFPRFIDQLKKIFFYAPELGQNKQYLINILISKLFGTYFYNGYFFACCLHGATHLGALLILFKLLQSYQLNRIWQLLIVTFLSYNPYVIAIHGIPVCEASSWFATAVFSFCFFKNYPFYKNLLSALLIGASHKGLAFFPLLFYTSMLKTMSWKKILITLFFIIISIQTINSSSLFKEYFRGVKIDNRHGRSVVKKPNSIKALPAYKLYTYRMIEGLFSPIITRYGFFEVHYSTIYAVIIASYDVVMFTFLLSCIAYSLVSKFKSFETKQKQRIISFLTIVVLLLIILGVAGFNYVVQIRHRSKTLILLLSLLGFLNQRRFSRECENTD